MNRYFYAFKKKRLYFLLVITVSLGMFYLGYRHICRINHPPRSTVSLPVMPVVAAKPAAPAADSLLEIKLVRERERSRETERIQEILERVGLSDDLRKQAEAELWRLAQATAKETELENLLKANGFAECLVTIGEKLVTVILGEKLNAEQAGEVGRFAAEVTGTELEQIQIVEKL